MSGWAGSDRRQRLPANWPTIVRRIKKRDQHTCQALQHHPLCDHRGVEVDHRIPNDDHSDPNLQLLSKACHAAKSSREGHDARPTNTRPPEPHPGLT